MKTPMRSVLLMFVLWAGLLSAQTPEKRIALVIGNSRYTNNMLKNPSNDARDMAAVLRKAGFVVTERYDQGYIAFNNEVTDFVRSFRDSNTVALFYYAGHGVQDNGDNYLVPVNADSLAEDEITFRCVPLERITDKMKGANNYMNIIILDACRNFRMAATGRSVRKGLAQFEGDLSESLIAYATAPGSVASDQNDRANGLFTEKLLKHIVTPGLEISEIFFEVRKDVKEQSNNKQIPSLVNNLTRKFYFFGGPPTEKTNALVIDTDLDGVPDVQDRCPSDSGPLQLQGCPDSDNDGVINMLDHCPQVFGSAANEGCPEEKPPTKKMLGWERFLGVSYSSFGTHDNSGNYLKTVSYNAYEVYYAMANKIGGFISIGAYSGTYDLVSSGDYVISTRLMGAIGPGFRVLNTSSGIRGYVFGGLMLFGNNSGEEVFGHKATYTAYKLFLAGNINHVGFKAGYIGGFEQVKGVVLGVHWCF